MLLCCCQSDVNAQIAAAAAAVTGYDHQLPGLLLQGATLGMVSKQGG